MSSIESQLLEYRAQKARERRKETKSPTSSQNNRIPDFKRSSLWSSVYRVMGVFDLFSKEKNPGLAEQSEALLRDNQTKDERSDTQSQSSSQTSVDVKSPDDDDGNRLITRNCITACSSETTFSQKLFLLLPMILKVILWIVLWGLFIEIGFGAVYFVVSLLIIMYFSMRTGRRKFGEMSAYSVFNPGQEKLDGTFTAEDFDRQLRAGGGIIH